MLSFLNNFHCSKFKDKFKTFNSNITIQLYSNNAEINKYCKIYFKDYLIESTTDDKVLNLRIISDTCYYEKVEERYDKRSQLKNYKIIKLKNNHDITYLVYCEGENELYYITKVHFDNIDHSIMRLIRSILICHYIKDGWHLIHCSSFKHNDNTFIMLGNKFSGKTTTLFSLVSDSNFQFITNDKALVKISSKGVKLITLPYSSGIRVSSLYLLDYIVQNLEAIQCSEHQNKIFIKPLQLEKFGIISSYEETIVTDIISLNLVGDEQDQITIRKLNKSNGIGLISKVLFESLNSEDDKLMGLFGCKLKQEHEKIIEELSKLPISVLSIPINNSYCREKLVEEILYLCR